MVDNPDFSWQNFLDTIWINHSQCCGSKYIDIRIHGSVINFEKKKKMRKEVSLEMFFKLRPFFKQQKTIILAPEESFT